VNCKEAYFFAERLLSPATTCFWRKSCVSRMCDKSAEGMVVRCTAPFGPIFFVVAFMAFNPNPGSAVGF